MLFFPILELVAIQFNKNLKQKGEQRMTFNFDEMEIIKTTDSNQCDSSGDEGSGCDCDGQEGD